MKRIITSFLLFFIAFNLIAQAPAGYYDAANGKTGYQLKTALKEIITNGHTDQGYDGLYTLYQSSDVDNYYENDGTLLDMYSENPSGTDAYEYVQTGDRCTGTYSQEGDCYNREHIMPQSAFGSAAPMKDDGHFVVPADGYVNNRRSNYPFGIVTNPTWTSSNGSKVGPNATPGYSGTVFEPIDEFKGDIARMLFYVATRYEDQIASWNSDMLNGTSDQVFADWFLDILLQWNADDPVSQREIDRNNAVYNYQGNRNPFIDHPEWVNEIWGYNRNISNVCASESFANAPNQSSYGTIIWTGDDGIDWKATDARSDQNLNGNQAILLRNGSLTNQTSYPNGCGTLEFDYARIYSGNSTLKVFVNGVQYGGDITVSSTSSTHFSVTVNVSGNIDVELRNSPKRTLISNLQWTCYSGTGPSITNITHSPSPVHSWETVSVSADVTDPDGVAGVELHWGTTSGNLNNTINMSLSSGNTYVTDSDIPAQPDGTTIYYEIYALDNNADATTSPEQSYTVNDAACASELIISEYVEGSSNNKYLEIYNGTGSTVNTGNYAIRIYANGASSPSTTINLNNTNLADGDVFVLANSSANAWSGTPDQTSGSLNFNGDDAVELYNTATGQAVDIIGKIGEDPGSQWGSGVTSTRDNTLVRKSSVTTGDTNGSDAFDPAVEWDGYAQDDVSHLGSHTMTCGPCSEPTTDATFHANSPQNIATTSLTLNWTNGDGDNRIVVMREGSPVTFIPTDGTTYTANSDFSVATDVSGNGEKVVYNGSGSTVDVTGLTPGTLYYAVIYEYNCSPGNEDYYTSGTPTTDSFYTTPEKPATFTADCVGETSIDLSWTAPASGNFDGYLVVAREGATPHSVNSLDPNTNLGENSDFSAAPTYGSTTPYSRILYKGTGTSVSITGLTNGTSYTFEVFAYSANGTLYRYSSGKQLTQTIDLNDVTSPTTSVANQQVTVSWTNPGSGCFDEILVVVNETAGIDFTPSGDGSAYTANTVYSGPNQVVYKGTGTNVTVTNLTNGTTYYFEIFVRQGTDWSAGVEVSAVPQDITILEPGDLAILAVNTDIDNDPGSNGNGSGDQIAFVCFKDIKPGTKIFLTDNGYEREVAGKWGNTEGVIAITRTGSILSKGTIIVLETNDQTTGNILDPSHFDVYTCGAIDNNWQKEFIAGQGGFNLNNDDDVWIMQGGVWDNGTTGNQDATYSGNVLYGWTESGWDNGVGNGTNGTKWSNLYPFSKCFTTVAPAGGGKVKFNDPVDPDFSTTTNDKLDWIALINNEANWDNYTTNADYDSGGYDYKNSTSCPAMTIATSTHSAGLWEGTNNTNWFDCSNWDNLKVPDENTDVTISGSAANEVIVDASAPDANLYSQIAKTNNLSIQNGIWVEVNTDNDNLEVHGNLTIESGGLLDLSDDNSGTGSDGHLYLYGHWNNQEGSGGLDGGNGTVHFVGSSTQTITTADPSGDETFPNVDLQNDFDLSVSGNLVMTGNLNIASGKTLDITDGKYLKTGGNITNNGSIIVRNHGDLVQTDDNSSISGSGTFRMDKTSLPLNHYYDYVYWSSPVNSNALTLGSILSNAWRYYAFDPSLQVPGINPNPGWVARTASDVFVVGNGVAISAPVSYSGGSLDVSFQHASDPFNNGQIDIPVTVNGTGGQNNDDWNLLGNPYPSAVDFDLFANDNANVQGSYYAWTNCAGLDAQGHHQEAGYTSYAVGTGGTAACSGSGQTLGRYIPTGLGFMIEALSGGTVSFHNSHRTTGHNDYFINRNMPVNRIWIDLQAQNEGIFSQNLIGFIDDATDGRDRLYDARHMLTGSAYLYTWTTDSIRCVIQGRRGWNGSTRFVPAGIFSTADRPMMLRIDRAEGVLDSIPVYVEDHLTQTVHDLRSGPYHFTAHAGDNPDRFTLIFGQRNLKAENTLTTEITIGSRDGLFRITSPYPLAEIRVYDMWGREIRRVNAASAREMLMDLRDIPSQALLMHIRLDDGRTLDRKVMR